MEFKTIEWKNNCVRLLDQRKLPTEICYVDCKTPSAVADAIRTMAIRGAPAIGVAAAMGIALAAKKAPWRRSAVLKRYVEKVCVEMSRTRPTAVNLFWAVSRMRKVLDQWSFLDSDAIRSRLEEEAIRIYKEDLKINRRIGENGKALMPSKGGVLTHCNAGALATAGFGTAVGVIQAAWDEGKRFHVFADETRPLLQGARLTAWELVQAKIPVTVIADSMAGCLMSKGKIQVVIVGADRIARNGDTANKIGTYGLAVLAKWHGIPFYVAAPISTVDFALEEGRNIPIEERSSEEITHFGGKRMISKEASVFNPAFDVTPHSLIHAIVTERGVIRKPFSRNLTKHHEP
jgi:methylthioribose-1-phosphate isomerase